MSFKEAEKRRENTYVFMVLEYYSHLTFLVLLTCFCGFQLPSGIHCPNSFVPTRLLYAVIGKYVMF